MKNLEKLEKMSESRRQRTMNNYIVMKAKGREAIRKLKETGKYPKSYDLIIDKTTMHDGLDFSEEQEIVKF